MSVDSCVPLRSRLLPAFGLCLPPPLRLAPAVPSQTRRQAYTVCAVTGKRPLARSPHPPAACPPSPYAPYPSPPEARPASPAALGTLARSQPLPPRAEPLAPHGPLRRLRAPLSSPFRAPFSASAGGQATEPPLSIGLLILAAGATGRTQTCIRASSAATCRQKQPYKHTLKLHTMHGFTKYKDPVCMIDVPRHRGLWAVRGPAQTANAEDAPRPCPRRRTHRRSETQEATCGDYIQGGAVVGPFT